MLIFKVYNCFLILVSIVLQLNCRYCTVIVTHFDWIKEEVFWKFKVHSRLPGTILITRCCEV